MNERLGQSDALAKALGQVTEHRRRDLGKARSAATARSTASGRARATAFDAADELQIGRDRHVA
jgi:hypothetical protein